MNFVSLFCGCGGFDLGFIQAGYDCYSAFDIDPYAVETHSNNLNGIAKKCDLAIETPPLHLLRKADVLLAGPPCQGFSTAGKRDLQDPRNSLLVRAGEIAVQAKPKVIIIENVLGVTVGPHKKYWDSLTYILRSGGYQTAEVVCNANEMGLGQIRRRKVLIAWNTKRHIQIAFDNKPYQSLRDVISGMDTTYNHDPIHISKGSEIDIIASRIKPGHKLCNVRGGPRSVHTWDIPEVYGRTNKTERQILELLASLRRRHRERSFGDADPISAQCLARSAGHPVKSTLIELIKKGYVRNINGRYDLTHTFNGKFRRLDWNLPSHTVDTRFGDPRYFLHPDKNRGFTVREAARIQGFPDDFVFWGPDKAQYVLVGNAVPPPISMQLAEFVRTALLNKA